MAETFRVPPHEIEQQFSVEELYEWIAFHNSKSDSPSIQEPAAGPVVRNGQLWFKTGR